MKDYLTPKLKLDPSICPTTWSYYLLVANSSGGEFGSDGTIPRQTPLLPLFQMSTSLLSLGNSSCNRALMTCITLVV
jgi:hypothetical protein